VRLHILHLTSGNSRILVSFWDLFGLFSVPLLANSPAESLN
jgi:hypothetical protein